MKLKINDRAAAAIKNGTKTIEIRINNNEDDFSQLKTNDVLEFDSQQLGRFYATVKAINYYESIEELLMMEGTRYTIQFTDNYDDVSNYDDTIKKCGVYAIHIEYLYSENTVWEELLEKARNVQHPRDISGLISAGSVGAAILTTKHHIYTGVCIDTASTLGMCAERNAIANMITNGESQIMKLVCVTGNNKVGSPCGACREYLMQLDKNSKNIEILRNENPQDVIRLEELIPDWWGYDRI